MKKMVKLCSAILMIILISITAVATPAPASMDKMLLENGLFEVLNPSFVVVDENDIDYYVGKIEILNQEEIQLQSQAINHALDTSDEDLADIRLSNFSNPAGTTLPINTSIEYTFDIGNYGTASTPTTIPLSIYSDNVLLGTTNIEGPIEPGYGLHIAIAIEITSTGNHTIRLQGNPNQSFDEVNYSNNSTNSVFTYISDLVAVDVAAYNISASGSAVSNGQITCGETVTFYLYIANYSKHVVSVPVRLLFNNSLAVGETLSFNSGTITTLSVPVAFNTGGNLTVTLQVDPQNTSGDWNMTNNIENRFYMLVDNVESERNSVNDNILFSSFAINGDSGMGIMVPVSLRVSAFGDLEYHLQNGILYLDEVSSSIAYPQNMYNPEVCTYNCDLGIVQMSSNSSDMPETIALTEYREQILPIDYNGKSMYHEYINNSKSVAKPFTMEYNYIITWSSNCVPAAGVKTLALSVN